MKKIKREAYFIIALLILLSVLAILLLNNGKITGLAVLPHFP